MSCSEVSVKVYVSDEFHMGISRALPTDAEDFAALVLISSPSLSQPFMEMALGV